MGPRLMSSIRKLALSAAAAIAVASIGCAKRGVEEPAFQAENCRRVTLVDEANAAIIVGAEDLAFDPATRRVFISAYDRRAVERAVSNRAAEIPEGGIYAAPIEALTAGASEISVRSLFERTAVTGGLRPHGVAFDERAGTLFFINRAYERQGKRWRMAPRLVEYSVAEARALNEQAVHCAANDVASFNDQMLLTFDHSDCGAGAVLENVFALRRSGFVSTDAKLTFDAAGHANGIAAIGDGRIAVAATRERSIHFVRPEPGDAFEVERVRVPGAPDNLTVAADGALIAAVHPSLLQIGLARKLGVGRSGSRIISLAPDSKAIKALFDDPTGDVIAAATVGLLVEDTLIVGSVIDDAIAVCERERVQS